MLGVRKRYFDNFLGRTAYRDPMPSDEALADMTNLASPINILSRPYVPDKTIPTHRIRSSAHQVVLDDSLTS